jgi:UTP-glucose-1-phosphate uridylyltransferase
MYGVVGIGEHVSNYGGKLFSLTQMVEKPARETAPSNLIITGRYILQPEIFDILAAEKRGTGGEIQLTDAMIELARAQPFYGLEFAGRSFDCGSKVGFLAANVAYARAPRHRAGHARGDQAADGRSVTRLGVAHILRLCPETLDWITKFSEHEAD